MMNTKVDSVSIDNVKEVTELAFPNLWMPIKVAMSTVASGLLSDVSHCIGVNFVGSPSSSKTTVLDMLGTSSFIYRCDSFTPKSFVSQFAGKSEEQLKKVDLLPRIKHKTVVIPELAPTLGARYEDLLANISTLTRIFDGRGLLVDGGTHGRRGYQGDYRFCWLAATTPLEHRVWQVLGKLGSRWVFFHMGDKDESESELADMLADVPYAEKLERARMEVQEFLESLWEQCGGFGAVKWNSSSGDNRALLKPLATIAITVARWRALAKKQDGEGFNPSVVESPIRLIQTLYCLARGHALLYGRRKLVYQDIAFVAQIAYSSMPEDRRRIFQHLYEHVTMTNKELQDLLGCSTPTAINIKKELVSLGLVRDHGHYISVPIPYDTSKALP